jgi:hypothetical protein
VRFPCATRQVIVGKSMAAGRDDRYLVRSQDEQPGRRFCEVLRTQDLPVTQAVTMLAATACAGWSANSHPVPCICSTGSTSPCA